MAVNGHETFEGRSGGELPAGEVPDRLPRTPSCAPRRDAARHTRRAPFPLAAFLTALAAVTVIAFPPALANAAAVSVTDDPGRARDARVDAVAHRDAPAVPDRDGLRARSLRGVGRYRSLLRLAGRRRRLAEARRLRGRAGGAVVRAATGSRPGRGIQPGDRAARVARARRGRDRAALARRCAAGGLARRRAARTGGRGRGAARAHRRARAPGGRTRAARLARGQGVLRGVLDAARRRRVLLHRRAARRARSRQRRARRARPVPGASTPSSWCAPGPRRCSARAAPSPSRAIGRGGKGSRRCRRAMSAVSRRSGTTCSCAPGPVSARRRRSLPTASPPCRRATTERRTPNRRGERDAPGRVARAGRSRAARGGAGGRQRRVVLRLGGGGGADRRDPCAALARCLVRGRAARGGRRDRPGAVPQPARRSLTCSAAPPAPGSGS